MRLSLRHLFLPHHTNNHRPKALQLDALLVYVVALLVFHLSVQALHRKLPNVLGYATNIYVDELLKDTNKKRVESGLAPLALNSTLSEAAAKKAQDMFAKNYWAHYSPDGKKPWDFINESGYSYTIAGENLAKNFSDSKQVVEAWMASSSHKDNILKAGYRDMGFAVVNGVLQGEETTLVVQMFGSSGRELAVAAPGRRVEINPSPAPVANHEAAVGSANVFSNVVKNPLIDIRRLSRDVAFVFIGILMGVLAMDAWLISRRRIVRVAGHSVAHIMLLGTLLFVINTALAGSIL